MHYLVVVRPFGSYRIGEIVSDEKIIQDVLASEHAESVVRIVPPVGG